MRFSYSCIKIVLTNCPGKLTKCQGYPCDRLAFRQGGDPWQLHATETGISSRGVSHSGPTADGLHVNVQS